MEMVSIRSYRTPSVVGATAGQSLPTTKCRLKLPWRRSRGKLAASQNRSDEETSQPHSRYILGLPERTFWTLIGIVLILALAVAGGFAGAKLASGRSRPVPGTKTVFIGTGTAATPSSTGSRIASNPPSNTPSGLSSVLAVTASVCGTNLQVYHQESSSGALVIQQWLDSGWAPASNLTLTVQPMLGTPLASLSWKDPNQNHLRLYYLTPDYHIAEASGYCTGGSCTWITNVIFNTAVNQTSSLGAMYMGTSGLRLYYHDEDGYVCELSYQSGGWNQGTRIALAYAGSKLAADPSLPGVYFVDGKGDLNAASLESAWQTSPLLPGANLTNWSTTAAITAVVWPDPPESRIFYMGTDRTIREIQYANGTAKLANTAPGDRADRQDAPAAAIAWTLQSGVDRLRMYYTVNGNVKEWTWQDNGPWRSGAF